MGRDAGEDSERSRNMKQGQEESSLLARGLKAQATQDYVCARLQMLFLMEAKSKHVC